MAVFDKIALCDLEALEHGFLVSLKVLTLKGRIENLRPIVPCIRLC
jgi:hypothetical protein